MLVKRALAGLAGLGLIAGLAGGILLARGTAAAAAPAPGQVGHVAGKITAIQGGTLTVQAGKQSATVSVGANTWILVKTNGKATPGSLSDLKVGDTVRAAGVEAAGNVLDARVLTDGIAPAVARKPAPAAKAALSRVGAEGTVQSVANGTVTLSVGTGSRARTVSLQTDAGTVVVKNGLASVGDLKAGDRVHVVPRAAAKPAAPSGTPTAGSPPAPRTAELIYVITADHVLAPARVQTVTGTTLTLRGIKQVRQVTVDAQTRYARIPAVGQAPVAATLSDVQAGDTVLIYAATPAAGQPPVASLVLVLPAGIK